MDPFIDLFLRIDHEGNGHITMNELSHYVKEHNMDPVMIEKWQQLFLTPDSEEITLERFCEVLGLKPADVIEKRNELNIQAGRIRSLGEDIQIIFVNMPIDTQINISDEIRTRLDNLQTDEDLQKFTEDVKEWLEKTYSGTWNFMVIDGSYWVSFSHVQDSSFHFFLRDRCFLAWQTAQ